MFDNVHMERIIITSPQTVGSVEIEAKERKCTKECEQCFEYADPVDNPRLNNQSNNVNKNRFHRVKRYNKKTSKRILSYGS